MLPDPDESPRLLYKVEGENGRRYLIYNALVMGDPSGHVPGKWYTRPYPLMVSQAGPGSNPHDTADEAEQSVGARARGMAEAKEFT
ncbi:hypothetical protein ACYOEI_01630 [Singulisphaera rosea]